MDSGKEIVQRHKQELVDPRRPFVFGNRTSRSGEPVVRARKRLDEPLDLARKVIKEALALSGVVIEQNTAKLLNAETLKN